LTSRTGSTRRTRSRAAGLALLLLSVSAPAAAAGPPVRSLELLLSQRADEPIVRALMTTRPGQPFRPDLLASDLLRLRGMGYALGHLRILFGDEGATVAVTASRVAKPPHPHVASLTLAGGIPAADAACRARFRRRVSTLFRRQPLDFRALLGGVAAAEGEYRARGHLEARVAELVVDLRRDAGSAHVEMRIEPGPRFTVGQVTVSGCERIDADGLRAALATPEGAPWSRGLHGELTARAGEFCREQGHFDASVQVVPAPRAGGTADAQVEVSEGEQTVLNNVVVRVEGRDALSVGDRGKEEVAELIALRRGEPVKGSEIDRLRRAIEDLGVFSRIEMLFVPLRDKPPGHRDLVIRLERVDLGREPTEAEELYCETVKTLIRLYNRGELRSFELSGSFPLRGEEVYLSVAVERPDYARVQWSDTKRRASGVALVRNGQETALHLLWPGARFRLPVQLSAKLAVLPPLFGDEPTRVELAPALVHGPTAPDVLLLGEWCPPVAAYFTELARHFERTPPEIDAAGRLVLPQPSGAGRMKVTLGGDGLPRCIELVDDEGSRTARFELRINPPNIWREPVADVGEDGPAAGTALTAAFLSALGLHGDAEELAEAAVAEDPDAPVTLAARGLVRLVSGPPEPGLADLRAAARKGDHPAYALLLAEVLVQGRRFADAKAACRECLESLPPRPPPSDPGELLLDVAVGLRAATHALFSRHDYRRRARIDLALAHIGLGEYDEAVEVVRGVLRVSPADAQAAEILARCELGLGRPEAALAALARAGKGKARPRLDVYAALAHDTLGHEAEAADALRDAIGKAPRFRNLLLLQEHAADIHPRYREAEGKVALARLLNRATAGGLDREQRAKLAAIVNDAFVLKTDVDRLADELARRAESEDLPPEELRRRALRRMIEDLLAVRWAVWRGLRADEREIILAMQSEMRELGAADGAEYRALLEERGTSAERRAAELRDARLKRAAFALVLADEVLVRPGEVRAVYERNPEAFRLPAAARFRMISLEFERFGERPDAVALAQALRRRLKDTPDSFAALAREYSHDANAERGGLWENVGRGSLAEPLDKAIFEMEPGTISDVVQTPRGCHIVQVEERQPERAEPLAEVAPKIVRGLLAVRSRAVIARWLAELRAESYVEILDAALTAGPSAGESEE